MTKKKPSPAAKARAALDPISSAPTAADSDLPVRQSKRSVVEEARPPPRLTYTAKEMMALLGISWPTLLKWSDPKHGKLPPPRRIPGTRTILWLAEEVHAAIANLAVRQLPLKGNYEEG